MADYSKEKEEKVSGTFYCDMIVERKKGEEKVSGTFYCDMIVVCIK